MKAFVLLPLALLTLLLAACTEPETPAEDPATPDEVTTNQVPGTPPGQTGSGSVQIHTGGAGALAPVTGTESLQGGGGGVNQAAKDQAHRAAGQAGGSSLDQLGDY